MEPPGPFAKAHTVFIAFHLASSVSGTDRLNSTPGPSRLARNTSSLVRGSTTSTLASAIDIHGRVRNRVSTHSDPFFSKIHAPGGSPPGSENATVSPPGRWPEMG